VTQKLGEALTAASGAVKTAKTGIAAGKKTADAALLKARAAADGAMAAAQRAEKVFNDAVAFVSVIGSWVPYIIHFYRYSKT
jgi:hypothetical protein